MLYFIRAFSKVYRCLLLAASVKGCQIVKQPQKATEWSKRKKFFNKYPLQRLPQLFCYRQTHWIEWLMVCTAFLVVNARSVTGRQEKFDSRHIYSNRPVCQNQLTYLGCPPCQFFLELTYIPWPIYFSWISMGKMDWLVNRFFSVKRPTWGKKFFISKWKPFLSVLGLTVSWKTHKSWRFYGNN